MEKNQANNSYSSAHNDDISLVDVTRKVKNLIKELRKKIVLIFFIGVLGSCLGILFSIFKKPEYRAVYTFVLAEEEKGGLSQYSGLASLAGIDIGAGGDGIFQGDNIIELYKSHSMIEKALLSTAVFNGKTQKLIDRYIEFNKLQEAWNEKAELKNIDFNGDPTHFDRRQDSIIIDLVSTFNKSVLSVIKPDKKLSIIEVNVFSKDELFAKEFANSIVSNVNGFYIQTKTKKLLQNVEILQKQADSVKSVLNGSITGVAAAADASPNANPLMSVLKVPSQRKQVDVQASTAIYAEVVKNLELSKIQLQKETPLIQAIDKPVLPLIVNKVSKIKAAAVGLILGFFLSSCWVIYKKLLVKS